MRGNIRVLCRIRPPKPSTAAPAVTKASASPTEVILRPSHPAPGARKEGVKGKDGEGAGAGAAATPKFFELDGVLGPESTQEAVFAEVRPTVQSVVDGFQVRVFCLWGWGLGVVLNVRGRREGKEEELAGGMVGRSVAVRVYGGSISTLHKLSPLHIPHCEPTGRHPRVRADGVRVV